MFRTILNQLSADSISKRLAHLFPNLKKELWIAQINQTPAEYVKEKMTQSFLGGGMMALLTFFLVDKMNKPYYWITVSFFVFLALFFYTMINAARAKMIERQKEIDKEVLFAGRFLLVKLHSGKPLINALMDASESYGVANNYFKSIVHEIEIGTTLEDALEKAMKYCPSKKMRTILFQITNALKIGIDVTQTLDATLDQISNDQLIEIQRYGKKLSSVTMFYMLGAIVLPSLGLTMFIVVASMMNLDAGTSLFVVLGIFLLIIEFTFITIFKAIRPNVNI